MSMGDLYKPNTVYCMFTRVPVRTACQRVPTLPMPTLLWNKSKIFKQARMILLLRNDNTDPKNILTDPMLLISFQW